MLSSDKRDLEANGSLKIVKYEKSSSFHSLEENKWTDRLEICWFNDDSAFFIWLYFLPKNGLSRGHYPLSNHRHCPLSVLHISYFCLLIKQEHSFCDIFPICFFLTNFYIASIQFQAMISKLLLWTVTIFAVSMEHGEALRVLGLFPHPGLSHFHFFHPIMRGLADAGHDVTVVSYFPDPKAPVNYKDLSLGNMDMLTNSVDLKVRMTPDREGKTWRRKKMCSIA